MFSFRRKSFWRSFRRRCCAGISIVAYLIAAGGLPLPAAPERKDTSQPFPCMHNPCGCETAEQCWRGCCCLTAEERWAWAEANGVRPPDYAERPASGGTREPSPTCARCAEGDSHKSCCKTESGSRGEDSAHSRPVVRWIVGASVLRCRGLATEWASAGAVLPPDPPVTWDPRSTTGGWVQRITPIAFPAPDAPPAPPPR